ncbi:hypothetical protein K470DRAFT_261086 [Piedraia hortae CBS 480.64]|uniref:Nucleoporin NSP1 n=1 Tax=Piedraia hortae CBS 480.64 TaxID=1314780 RepID=A0A6A7BQS7_9PEZI|nr:hypothetical protein K470DRAFT_261086 [Piedraia hortae CBS 480.64]
MSTPVSGFSFLGGGQAASGTNTSKPEEKKTASSIFGKTATVSGENQSGSGLFGSTSATPPTKTPAQTSFTPAGNPPALSMFGASKPDENKSPFSWNPASTQDATAATGTAAAGKPAAQQQPSSLFGAPKTTAAGTTTSSLFSGLKSPGESKSSTSASAPASFLGGFKPPETSSAAQPLGTPTTTSGPASGNIFGSFTAPSATLGTAQPATPAFGSIFNKPKETADAAGSGNQKSEEESSSSQPAATKTTTAGSTSNIFDSLKTQTSSSETSQPATTTTAPATSTASSTSNLFGGAANSFGSTKSATATTEKSETAATKATAPASGSTATAPSTVGAAPPQQSRLAGKTMDEILTMWSTSLATHQKTFQQLAQRVSTWDKMLVENSGKISLLYSRCFQAERDCSEVERQLSIVESSQQDLEALLDRYEGEVDRMLAQAGLGDGGNGVSGVDAERERTYKMAEQCSTRLTEMSHNLTEMIEAVNSASGSLASSRGKSRPGNDDALSEIVRVLNSHLSQLQVIDQGATDLQSRVVAAQQEAKHIGRLQGHNGDSEQWIKDFGRSYLGRR